MKILFSFLFIWISFPILFSQQLIINEISQGTGNAEYVEFVVVGTPGCAIPAPCIDLRNVIIDDNNGYFQSGGSAGIAAGAIRFSNTSFWSCIPQGTFIVIYNESNKNAAIPSDDISLSDNNCRLILPANSSLLEGTDSAPNNSNPAYPSGASWTAGTGSWSTMAMNNSYDSFQITDGSGTPYHSVSWGSNTNNTIIYFAGSAGGMVFSFTNSINNNWNNQSNWSAASSASDQTPGYANSPQNDAFIGSMNPQCGMAAGISVNLNAVNESCPGACNGNIEANVSGGTGPYSFAWSNGFTTEDISNLCPGSYTLTVTDASGCSTSENLTVGSNTNSLDPSIVNPGMLETSDAPVQLVVSTTGGVFSSDCGACLLNGGVFDPSISGAGIFNVCYTLGNGVCAVQECIAINVGNPCTTDNTSEDIFICNGDSALVFGQYEYETNVFTENHINIMGCDSVHTINLTVAPSYDEFVNLSTCEGDSVAYATNYYIHDTILYEYGVVGNGCSFTRTISIKINECTVDEDYVLYVPNVFTPNFDNVNDIFKIELLGGRLDEGYIINRWGNTIYTFNPENLSWNGETNSLPVQDGVYTYLLFVTPNGGVQEKVHGFVTVIR